MSEALYAIKFFDLRLGLRLTGPSQDYDFNVPKFGTPGKWHVIPRKNKLKICEVGFHVPFLESLLSWKKYYAMNSYRIAYIVQLGGDYVYSMPYYEYSKFACRRIRLIKELTGFSFNNNELEVLKKEYRLLDIAALHTIENNYIQYKE